MDQDGDYDIAFSNREKQQYNESLTTTDNVKPIPNPNKDYDVKTQNQEQNFSFGSKDFSLSDAAHPYACIATVGFKALAILLYFLGSLAPVAFFIFVTICSALDFWTVKNITGRLLVGLRWWSSYDEKGQQIWKFQSPNKQFQANPVDKAFFWASQLIATLFWGILVVIKALGMDPFWWMLVTLNMLLSGTNLYGFYKCKGDHQKKLKGLKSEGLKQIAQRIF